MPDIADVRQWHELISDWRNVADRDGAEFKLERFPDGKEMMMLRLYYHKPRKDILNGKKTGNNNFE